MGGWKTSVRLGGGKVQLRGGAKCMRGIRTRIEGVVGYFLSISYSFSLKQLLHSLLKSLIYNYLNDFSFAFVISETIIILDCKQNKLFTYILLSHFETIVINHYFNH